jgi:opacity protein-like surface antigen
MKRVVAVAVGAGASIWGAAAYAQTAPTSFYVRADAGASIPTGSSLQGFDTSAIVSAGVGAKILPFLRTDFTLSYRTEYAGAANESVSVIPAITINDNLKSNLRSLVGMANAYYDLPTLSGITPYLGGGVGFARNEVGTTTIVSTVGAVSATSNLSGATETNFAWQVGAGAAVGLAPGIALDFAYHYLDAGKFSTGTTLTGGGIVITSLPASTGRLHAHEVTAGIRVGL